jgi:hypothetical protein
MALHYGDWFTPCRIFASSPQNARTRRDNKVQQEGKNTTHKIYRIIAFLLSYFHFVASKIRKSKNTKSNFVYPSCSCILRRRSESTTWRKSVTILHRQHDFRKLLLWDIMSFFLDGIPMFVVLWEEEKYKILFKIRFSNWFC